MPISMAIGLVAALGAISLTASASAEGTVSDYLRDGWEIKAVTQTSANGFTQLILQKANRVTICTIYYSVVDNKWGWVPKGCDLLP